MGQGRENQSGSNTRRAEENSGERDKTPPRNKRGKRPNHRLRKGFQPITITSHFAEKLYGMRSHKYKKLKEGVKKLIEEAENE